MHEPELPWGEEKEDVSGQDNKSEIGGVFLLLIITAAFAVGGWLGYANAPETKTEIVYEEVLVETIVERWTNSEPAIAYVTLLEDYTIEMWQYSAFPGNDDVGRSGVELFAGTPVDVLSCDTTWARIRVTGTDVQSTVEAYVLAGNPCNVSDEDSN